MLCESVLCVSLSSDGSRDDSGKVTNKIILKGASLARSKCVP